MGVAIGWNHIGILMVFPIVPSLYLTFNPVATQDWMYAVSMFVLGLALVMDTARLFQRESIIQ